MVMLPCPPAACQPAAPAAHAGLLKASRSQRSRPYDVEPAGLAPLAGAFVAGTRVPALIDLWVALHNGGKATRYGVSLCGWTSADGLLAVWYKLNPDGRYSGTSYNLSFSGFAGSCDCPACCWESVGRADRRHGDASGSYGCQKLDTFAKLVETGTVPNPLDGGEADRG